MGKSGDNLTVWKWFEDRLSAEAWADTQRDKGVTMYVLGKIDGDTESTKKESSSEKK